jgi:HAMP domain-containing protein
MAAESRGGDPRDGGALRQSLRGLAVRPFSSLPSRIITSVFAAAIVTSFAVAYTATQSTEDFLRQKIDERLPNTLARTAERLDDWYAQRELDISTLARSDTVLDSLSGGAEGDPVAQEEARKYLAHVREGFPPYAALFVLDPTGSVRVWVGEQPLPAASLRERLATTRGIRSGTFFRAGTRRVQFISSPIGQGVGAFSGSLHAMVGADAIESLLRSDELESTTRVLLVSSDGEIVVHSQGAAGLSYPRPIPGPGPSRHGLVAEDYLTDTGEHVVGSAMRLARFGWGLVVEESYDAAFAPIVSVRRRITAINLAIVLAFGLLAFLIARSIVQPIHALSRSARRIAQGETDVEIPAARGHDEIAVLSRALSEMVGKLHRANADLVDANEELRRGNEVLEQLSFTDGLTRLHNHRYFQDRLRVETRRVKRIEEPLALLLIDIDNFKGRSRAAHRRRRGRGAGGESLLGDPRGRVRGTGGRGGDAHPHDRLDRGGDLRGRREALLQRRGPRPLPGEGERQGLRGPG